VVSLVLRALSTTLEVDRSSASRLLLLLLCDSSSTVHLPRGRLISLDLLAGLHWQRIHQQEACHPSPTEIRLDLRYLIAVARVSSLRPRATDRSVTLKLAARFRPDSPTIPLPSALALPPRLLPLSAPSVFILGPALVDDVCRHARKSESWRGDRSTSAASPRRRGSRKNDPLSARDGAARQRPSPLSLALASPPPHRFARPRQLSWRTTLEPLPAGVTLRERSSVASQPSRIVAARCLCSASRRRTSGGLEKGEGDERDRRHA